MLFRVAALCVFMLFSASSLAAVESYDFENETQRARYLQLTEELRCPKCQNQNLADSDSQIAADLRRELHAQLLAGKSDDAILGFMQERYGDFVLYKPRLQRNTVLLWFGPVILMTLVLWWVLRRRPAVAGAVVADSDSVVAQQAEAGVQIMSPVSAPGLSPQAQNAVAVLLLLAVVGGTFMLYRMIGAGPALEITAASHELFSGTLSPEAAVLKQAAVLEQLDDELARHPDNKQFLYVRARLLSESGMWDKAIADYRQLIAQFPDQDNLLAEYAQALYLQNNRMLNDDASAFLKQALAVNPQNVTALGLLGMQAFEDARYAESVEYWGQLLAVLPAGSTQAATIQSGLDRARSLGNLPAATASQGLRLLLQVSLADAVNAQPDETVFILLRAAGQRGMPLAAVRTTVAALSEPVILDTASSPMQRGQPLPTGALEVVARLSRSGQPTASAGDWEAVLPIENTRAIPTDGKPFSMQIAHPVTP